jgi:hypothetical protein
MEMVAPRLALRHAGVVKGRRPWLRLRPARTGFAQCGTDKREADKTAGFGTEYNEV